MSRSTQRLVGVAAAGVLAAAIAGPAIGAPAPQDSAAKVPGPAQTQLDIQILSFNDFHGNLEEPAGSGGRIQVGPATTDTVNAGGVEYLATHLAAARAGHTNTVTVAAGDLVGASPLLSAAFHDEPTIESMNLLGLEITSVGNHEFDEGYKELQRLQAGGCIDDGAGADNQDSCAAHQFEGSKFQFLAANVIETSTGKTILPSYAIKKWNGAKIGFIGMTLEGTPSIVTAAGVAGLEFTDEVETANALVPELKALGVNAIVVLIHEGGNIARNKPYDYTCGGGGTISGPIVDISKNLDPAIDMVISGHTHQPYICDIPDPAGKSRLVTSASSFGRLYTETNVTYDRRTQDIVRSSVAGSNKIVTRDVAKNAEQTSLIGLYKTLITPIASRVIGTITQDILRSPNAAGESALGDLIADAQLADPSTITDNKTPVIAFMNPGGIRTDLDYDLSKYGEPLGAVTFEEAFTVQPFNNYLVSMDLTGQQVIDVLNQQFIPSAGAPSRPYVLAPSRGLTYTHNGVVASDVKLGGVALDPGATYRVVTNSFMSDGGDGFPAFRGGVNKYFGGLDIDAFADYLGANSPYTPGPLDRITRN